MAVWLWPFPSRPFLLVVLWNGVSKSSRFRHFDALSVIGGREFDLSGSRDVMYRSRDHLIPCRPIPIPLEPSLVSEIFDGECDAMVDMTLNDLKGQGHLFWNQSISHIGLRRLRLPVELSSNIRRPYNLYCVGADIKPCSINQSICRVTFGLGRTV